MGPQYVRAVINLDTGRRRDLVHKLWHNVGQKDVALKRYFLLHLDYRKLCQNIILCSVELIFKICYPNFSGGAEQTPQTSRDIRLFRKSLQIWWSVPIKGDYTNLVAFKQI